MNSIEDLNFSATKFKAVLAQVFYPHGQSVLRSFKNLVTSCNDDIWKSQEKLKKRKSREIISAITYAFSAKKKIIKGSVEGSMSALESSCVADPGMIQRSGI